MAHHIIIIMDLITKALQEKLNKVGTLTVNYLDRTQGVKEGKLFTIKPSFKYKMLTSETLGENGKYTYDSVEPKEFDCANILLINRYKSKQTNEWVEELIPAFAINLKSIEQPDDNKVRYCTMMFRGTSFERLMDELINAHQSGADLDRAKALYSIITSNGLSVSNFFEHLSGGNSIEFAQYKRGNNMNFVDTKYYRDKIEPNSTEENDI